MYFYIELLSECDNVFANHERRWYKSGIRNALQTAFILNKKGEKQGVLRLICL